MQLVIFHSGKTFFQRPGKLVSKSLRLKKLVLYQTLLISKVYTRQMGGIDSALQSFTDLKITKCFGHLFSCSFFKKVKQDRRKKESTKKFRQFILVPFFELKSIRILNILGHNSLPLEVSRRQSLQ